MNKIELISVVAEKTGMNKKELDGVMAAIFDTIAEELSKGGPVKIAGFGVFEVKNRAARLARNPHTGEMVNVAASKAPVFKPSKDLKKIVNG